MRAAFALVACLAVASPAAADGFRDRGDPGDAGTWRAWWARNRDAALDMRRPAGGFAYGCCVPSWVFDPPEERPDLPPDVPEGWSRVVEPVLIALAGDSKQPDEVRGAALLALGRAGRCEIENHQVATDPGDRSSVRGAASRAVALGVGRSTGAMALRGLAGSEEEPETVRVPALLALGLLGFESPARTIEWVLVQALASGHRDAAAAARAPRGPGGAAPACRTGICRICL